MNALRSMHSAPGLVPNDNLMKTAVSWGYNMATKNSFQHSNYDHGENLALAWYNPGDGLDGTNYVIDAINMWYAEVTKYDFLAPSFGTGHFTQLVWKSSREYGVSAVYDGDMKVYITMEYDPPGNYYGAYVYNVFPLKLALKAAPPCKKPAPPSPRRMKYI